MTTWRSLSWNINGIRNPVKRKQILTYLKWNRTDVYFLQETHLNIKQHEKLGRIWWGHIFLAPSSSRDVCILLNKHFPFIPEKVERDPGGRFTVVRGKVLSEVVTLVNVYAPNCEDLNFFRSRFFKLSEVEGHIIIAGNLNLTLNKMDCSNNKNPRKCRSRKVIMKDLGLCDIWRYTHPKTQRVPEYSFHLYITPSLK